VAVAILRYYKILSGYLPTVTDKMNKTRSSRKNNLPIFVWYDMDHTEAHTSDNFSIVGCVFVAAGMCLRSHCLVMTGRIHIQTHIQVSSGSTIPGFRCWGWGWGSLTDTQTAM
jgi:hypothetical protein